MPNKTVYPLTNIGENLIRIILDGVTTHQISLLTFYSFMITFTASL
jgi:hypothetical protein